MMTVFLVDGIWKCLLTLENPEEVAADNDKDNKTDTKQNKKETQKKKGDEDKKKEGDKEDSSEEKAVERPYGSDYEAGQIMMMVYGDQGTAGPLMLASDNDDLTPGVAFEREVSSSV